MKSRFYYLFFLLIFAAESSAQQLHIVDFWTEAPLANVKAIATKDTLITRQNGIIELQLFNEIPKTIILQKQNYYSRTVLLKALESNIIKLTPVESIDCIDVFSEKPGDLNITTPTHATFLPTAELIESGVITLDRALETQAGIFIKSYGGTGQIQSISLRGMSAEQTQLFIDGIPVNNMQLGATNPGQYDLQQIELIEIYRGGNAHFGGGGTIGGAINLKSRPIPDSLKFMINLRGETLQNAYAGLSLGLPTGPLKHDFSVNAGNGENKYSVTKNGNEVSLSNRDFTRWNMRYRAAFPLSEKIKIEALAYTYKFTGGSPAAFDDSTSESRNRARISHDNSMAAASLQYHSRLCKINLRSFLRNEWTDYTNPDLIIGGEILASNHFNHELGFLADGQFIINNNLFINAGIEASGQKVHSSESGNNSRQRYAFFLKGEYELPWSFINNWRSHISGSLRGESYSDFGGLLLPGIGLTMHTKNFKLFVSAGKNYRAPTFNELYWRPGGNPDLHPENSVNIETGIEYNLSFLSVIAKFSAALYSNSVNNQIRWRPVSADIWSPQNILQTRSCGIELHAEISDMHKQTRLIANYSYGTVIKTSGEYENDPTVGNRLPYIPAENWSLTFYSGFNKLRGGFQISGSGFQYLSFSNDPYDYLPSYFTARCWAGFLQSLGKVNINLSAGVENLLDRQYQATPGFPMPPRHFYIELKLNH